jgi:redox-sensitive bicupin YhaK (pirin superfamily)
MHAGTGIVHGEYNRDDGPTRLFQIWILPDQHGAQPGWQARVFPKQGGLQVLASGRVQDHGSDALPLNADAAVLAGTLAAGEMVRLKMGEDRAAYLVPATGRLRVNGVDVATRDGVAITGERELTIIAEEESETVLVDVRRE